MHFIYVDESGDPGRLKQTDGEQVQPSRHFLLTGLIVAASEWREYLSAVVDIRRDLRDAFGLPVRAELHGAELLHPRHNPIYRRLGNRAVRARLYQAFLRNTVLKMPKARVVNVHLDKANPRYPSTADHPDWLELTWERLLQRFQNYLARDCANDLGLVFSDETNEPKVRRLLRRIRVYNRLPSRFGGSYSAPLDRIVEDPVIRQSAHSFFIQTADMIAYALYHKLYPKGSYRRYNVDRMFDLTEQILLKQASREDPWGIVHL